MTVISIPAPLTVLSQTCPFVTLAASDLTGPPSRQRVLARAAHLPDWLRAWERYVTLGQTLVAVSMGRARLGSTIRISSIIRFAATNGRPAFSHIYVQELEVDSGAPRSGAPIHVIRCAMLPTHTRFIEVPSSKKGRHA
jgi:hypothetical protein